VFASSLTSWFWTALRNGSASSAGGACTSALGRLSPRCIPGQDTSLHQRRNARPDACAHAHGTTFTSSFHVVSEFDGSAHSCRRQLALHNERRRKAYAARKGVTTVNPPRGTATGGLYNPVTGAGALLGGGLLGDPSQLYGGAQLLGMGAHPGFAVIHPAFLGSAAGQGGLVHGGSGYVLPSGGPFSLGFDPSGGSATLSALVPAALAAVAAAAQAQAQAQAQAAHMPHGGNNMAVQQAAMQAQHASQVALALLNNAAGIANAEWRGPQQQG